MVPLEDYRKKRRFDKTPEPSGSAESSGEGLSYVIQKHAASRLHYDFRLELDGVLLSWAVPKGPSLDPKDRHLAVKVEDHPLEYGGFEGTIPEGEYGAGTVQLWDRGTWEPSSDPHEGLRKGDLKFTLHGEKLGGSWVLVRMKPRQGEADKNWLLIKHRDEQAVDGDGQAVLAEEDRSVLSGRTLEEIAVAGEEEAEDDEDPELSADVRPLTAVVYAGAPADSTEHDLDPSTLDGARAADRLPDLRPMAARNVALPPSGDDWLHEVKLDGYRVISRIDGDQVEMRSRNDKDWTQRFGPLAEDLSRLPLQTAVLDGEVVVQMPDGTTDFQALQDLLGSMGRGPLGGGGAGAAETEGLLVYYVFDLLHLDGYDLMGAPLSARKDVLEHLLAKAPVGSRILYSGHILGSGPKVFEEACAHELEGIVSKRAASSYRSGARSADWAKSKCRREQEFVVGGWTDPAGGRSGLGALLLGVYEQGVLRYVGKVGSGFGERTLGELQNRLRPLETDTPAFRERQDLVPKDAHWVVPELVAQVAFTEWTRDGGLRHPSFKGLRDDKAAEEVVAERLPPVGRQERASRGEGSKGGQTDDDPRDVGGRKGGRPTGASRRIVTGVTVTHPDKVLWADVGATKLDLVDYYRRVAEWMLPYVVGRPLAMVRCPEGVDGPGAGAGRGKGAPCFFHKHPGGEFPGPFRHVTIEESGGPDTYLAVSELGSLIGLAQMGVLEIHVWGSTWPDIERPDLLVFDLDPDPTVEWKALAEGARLMREVLSALGLESFVKTTGGKGLHVEAPITPGEEWAVVRTFCRAVAEAFVAHAPDRYTANMSKAKRGGKIYVDYVRNNRGATSIAPYSTRARERATVAVPLRWSELSGSIRPDTYTIKNLARRLGNLKGDPWEGWAEVKKEQTLTGAMRRAVGAG